MNLYDIIYSDPAWQQSKGGLRKARPNQGRKLDYETLSLEDIKSIHKEFSSRANEKHNFFVWTIDKYLHETEQMMKELGYTLHARMIWDKENGVAPAFTVRFSHEYLLWFYKKGNMLMPCTDMRGKQTAVKGSIQNRTYDTKEGEKRYITEIVADRLQILEWEKEQNNAQENNYTEAQIDDEDLPFQ